MGEVGEDGNLGGMAEDAVVDVFWVASRGWVGKRSETCSRGGGRWERGGVGVEQMMPLHVVK